MSETLPARRKRLAIVSSYNELCGNATYTHVLAEAFRAHYDVDIIPLNVRLLRHTEPRVAALGDAHIREMARKLSTYDYVNIQFEAGLFGVTPAVILHRTKMLLGACANAIVTMHRIDTPQQGQLSLFLQFLRAVYRRKPALYFQEKRRREDLNLYREVLNTISRSEGRIKIIVHTKRELETIKLLYGYPHAYDFPITFLSDEKRAHYAQVNIKEKLIKKYNLPADANIIGQFGFISRYKSIETVLKALRVLPKNWYVLIFGALHPQAIPQNETDKYLDELLENIESQSVKVGLNENMSFYLHRENEARDRVRFCGNLNDEEFIEAMHSCDAVAIPYLETGQSMSGIASLAIETKSNAIFSNNLSFAELNAYYRDCTIKFDVGNYVELAQRIIDVKERMKEVTPHIDKALKTYNIENNIALHCRIFEGKQ